MKKNLTTVLFLVLAGLSTSYSQSVINKVIVRDHTTNEIFSLFNIQKLGPATGDAKFQRALKQSDVIGDDYYGEERIGFAHNENSYGTSTDYHPIDGYKRTFCGSAQESFFRKPGFFGSDDDLNIFINVAPTNDLLITNKGTLRQKLGADFDTKWNVINGEIDIANPFHKSYEDNGPEIRNGHAHDDVCLYGAWAAEVEGVIPGHGNYNEVHPAEQFWFKPRVSVSDLGACYTLSLAVDDSHRYDSYSEYEDGTPEKLWAKAPLNGVFAIAFEIHTSSKEQFTYTIDMASSANVSGLIDDGKFSYLIYNSDTIVKVVKNLDSKLVNIGFDNVGYHIDKLNGNPDTTIRGFMLIKSRIASTEEIRAQTHRSGQIDEGNLLLNVCKRIYSPKKVRVNITLEKIKRLENNSYGGINPLTNKLVTRFHPLSVPPNFSEMSVNFEVRIGNAGKSYHLDDLEIGQEQRIDNSTMAWEGQLGWHYTGLVKFSTKYGVNDFQLGQLELYGDPVISKTLIVRSTFPFPLGGETIDINLFELTFKIEPVQTRVERILK